MSRSFYLFSLFFCLTLLAFMDARAAEYTVTPSVSLRETYDDNIFFRDVDDFEHLISSGLGFGIRTETSEIQASGTWDISEYQRHNELDTVDQTYGLSAGLTPGPLWRFDFMGEFRDDYTFVSALEESGVLAESSRRKRVQLQPSATMVVDSRNRVELSYDFTKVQYRLESYPDYRVQGASLVWQHDLINERTTVLCSLGGNYVDFEASGGDVKQQTYRVLAGIDHKFTETLQLTFMVGPRFTESEFPRGGATVDDDKTGAIVDATLDWRLERLHFSANANRDITQSIYGENMTRDRLRLGLMYQFTEKFRSNLSTAYYESETDGFIDDEKRQTCSVRPSVAYRLTKDLDLRVGYAYTWTENKLTDDSEEQNRVFAELSLRWPIIIN